MVDYAIDAVVVGAGVVGLAIARQLAMSGLETLVIEREASEGTQTSSRNSQVIHAGLYYPKGSLKQSVCRRGRDMLYRYCAERGIAAKACGKLVVATSQAELGALDTLYATAAGNAVPGLSRLTAREVSALEPELRCVGAFHSPQTGIIDGAGLMLAFRGDLEDAGGAIAFNTPVESIQADGGQLRVVTGGPDAAELSARIVVNSAGHGAPVLAGRTAGLPPSGIPRQWFAKGNYFSLSGRQPFSRLVYPIPEAAGLGVHVTIDLQGRCRFGPDVEWVENDRDLTVDPARADVFYDAVRAYWPGLADGALQPDYAGIRPKIHGPADPLADFRVDGPQHHGVAGLVNLFGIESPGLTSSLALAGHVAGLLEIETPS